MQKYYIRLKRKIMDLLGLYECCLLRNSVKSKIEDIQKAVDIVEEIKKRITDNSNYDMSIDNLLLRIWEQFA